MPDVHIELTDDDLPLLERVRDRVGLESLEQAAQWLIKARLRRAAKQMTGRGRALRLVPHKTVGRDAE